MPKATSRTTSRRRFIQSAAIGGLALADALSATNAQEAPKVTQRTLGQWHGFNLLEKFTRDRNAPFVERDFQWMANWGFTFVRLPMDYRCWIEDDDPMKLKESALTEVDQAVAFGKQYGIHVNLNFHRAPGYTVARPPEPLDLWTDEQAQAICEFHWRHFAQRYKGIPSQQVSFNLFNEPGAVDPAAHERVVRRMVGAIREQDPQRLIIVDGLRWGSQVVQGLEDLGVAQSTRGYAPMGISHYRASWIGGSDTWREPKWPGVQQDGQYWDKEKLRGLLKPWIEKTKSDPGVHVGEFGAFVFTPHQVVLSWMRDWLDLWAEAGIGWALWNLRGGFGIVDTGRKDVTYEKFDGDHQLDREMLELLREHAATG